MSNTAWRAMRMRYPLAYNTGRFMYQNRANFMRARAMMIQGRRSRAGALITKRARNYMHKRRTRRKIGDRIGTSRAKVHEVIGTNDLYNTRTRYDHTLLDIPHQKADGIERAERSRQIANIRGFKICCGVNNERTNPLYINIAVLASKGSGFTDNDFFRADGNERSVDFGTSLSSIQFRCCPVNSDKYHILMHRRLLLNGSSAITGVDYTRTSYNLIEKWVPLKRQIRYEDNEGATPTEDIRLVWWADSMFQSAGAIAQVDAFRIQWKVVNYFRDPRN